MKQRLAWISAFSIIFGLLFGFQRQTEIHHKINPPTWLRVLTFSDILSDEVIQVYRKTHNVRVLLNTVRDVTHMESLIKEIGDEYDLIIAYGYQLKRLESELQPLPQKLADSLPIVADVARSPDSPRPTIAPPILWGIEGLVVNTKKITTVSSLTSWSDLFRVPHLKKRIGFPRNPYEVIGYLQRRNLISSDYLNSLATESGQQKIREFLDVVDLQWSSQPDRLINNELWAMQMSNGQAARLLGKHPDLRFFIPEEGSTLWSLNVAIPKKSQNISAAQGFISYLFEPSVGKKLVKTSHAATVHRDLEHDTELEPMEKASFLRSVPVHRIRFIESVVAGQAERLERLLFQSDRS